MNGAVVTIDVANRVSMSSPRDIRVQGLLVVECGVNIRRFHRPKTRRRANSLLKQSTDLNTTDLRLRTHFDILDLSHHLRDQARSITCIPCDDRVLRTDFMG